MAHGRPIRRPVGRESTQVDRTSSAHSDPWWKKQTPRCLLCQAVAGNRVQDPTFPARRRLTVRRRYPRGCPVPKVCFSIITTMEVAGVSMHGSHAQGAVEMMGVRIKLAVAAAFVGLAAPACIQLPVATGEYTYADSNSATTVGSPNTFVSVRLTTVGSRDPNYSPGPNSKVQRRRRL